MAEGKRGLRADRDQTMRDWIAIWQSEASAIATDREMQEGWQRLAALWAQSANAMADLLAYGADSPDAERPARRTGPAETARPATPAAAPDTRDAEIERLGRRVAELERRLAELQSARGGS